MSGTLRKGSTCPTCKKAKLVPIVYGLPTSDVAEREGARQIVLGGCCVTGNEPELECLGCEARFMRDGDLVLIYER